MPKGKHLTLDDRRSIQCLLNEGVGFKDMARHIGKDPSTVSKEVRMHAITRKNSTFNPCILFAKCKHSMQFFMPLFCDAMIASVTSTLQITFLLNAYIPV